MHIALTWHNFFDIVSFFIVIQFVVSLLPIMPTLFKRGRVTFSFDYEIIYVIIALVWLYYSQYS